MFCLSFLYFSHANCKRPKMIQERFNIKTIESLSGIKIPTIRTWEKRYSILKPNRTETGVRLYTTEEVSHFLNIVYLNKNGWKISNISKLSKKEIQYHVNTIDETIGGYSSEIDRFILAILTFNQDKINLIYKELVAEYGFEKVVEDYLFPLLYRIGILWQTDTIEIIHEHFISSFIKQKIIFEIENNAIEVSKKQTLYILFLPSNEMHEIALRYLQYKLSKAGRKTLYLGNHTELNQLLRFKNQSDLEFITNLTVNPHSKSLDAYMKKLYEFSNETQLLVRLFGPQFQTHQEIISEHEGVLVYQSSQQLMDDLKI